MGSCHSKRKKEIDATKNPKQNDVADVAIQTKQNMETKPIISKNGISSTNKKVKERIKKYRKSNVLKSPINDPFVKLIKILENVDDDFPYICANCSKFNSHYRRKFMNIQEIKTIVQGVDVYQLAENVLLNKNAYTSCIYIRLYDISPASGDLLVVSLVIQLGVLPEQLYKQGTSQEVSEFINAIVRKMPSGYRRLFRYNLSTNVQDFNDSPSLRIYVSVLRNSNLELAFREVIQILSLFRRVQAFSIQWHEDDHRIIIVIHYKLDKIESSIISPVKRPLQINTKIVSKSTSLVQAKDLLSSPSIESPQLAPQYHYNLSIYQEPKPSVDNYQHSLHSLAPSPQSSYETQECSTKSPFLQSPSVLRTMEVSSLEKPSIAASPINIRL